MASSCVPQAAGAPITPNQRGAMPPGSGGKCSCSVVAGSMVRWSSDRSEARDEVNDGVDDGVDGGGPVPVAAAEGDIEGVVWVQLVGGDPGEHQEELDGAGEKVGEVRA